MVLILPMTNSRSDNGLGIRVLGGLLIVFCATWVVNLVLGVGVKQTMDWLAADPNVRAYVGAMLSRGGLLAATVLFSTFALKRLAGLDMAEVAFRLHPGWWKDLIFGCTLLIVIMTGLFIVEVSQGWLVLERWGWESQPTDAWVRSLWLALLTNTVVGVGEEVMFRGYLLTGLGKAWGSWSGLALTMLLFALPHLLVADAAKTPWPLFIAFLSLPGLVLGYAYLRAGSLWLPIGIHFAWDLAYDLLNLTGTTGQSFFGAITHQQGPAWIVGTGYGIEVGLAGVLVAALALISVWLWTQRRNDQTTVLQFAD